jgi:hypothetical protein
MLLMFFAPHQTKPGVTSQLHLFVRQLHQAQDCLAIAGIITLLQLIPQTLLLNEVLRRRE